VRSDPERVLDILEAIGNIRRRLPDGFPLFQSDEMVQVWVIHHLITIGEAANGLSDAALARHPGLPWRDIIGMRHMLIHQYYRRNLQTVWDTVCADLPALERAMRDEAAEGAP